MKMEIEKKAFLFMFILGILYGIPTWTRYLHIKWATFARPRNDILMHAFMFWSWASGVIDWILFLFVLIVMYYVGKKLDLKANLKSIIISMLAGGLIGGYLVFLVSIPISHMIEPIEITPAVVFLVILASGLFQSLLKEISSFFFPSFTAVAIAHFRKHMQTSEKPHKTDTS